jgi:hypothetical protein
LGKKDIVMGFQKLICISFNYVEEKQFLDWKTSACAIHIAGLVNDYLTAISAFPQ